MIVILDYGIGNVQSVRNALKYLGNKSQITNNPEVISSATHLILPGVGAFADGMRGLKKYNLIELLTKQVLIKNKFFLGICLGMQLLGDESEEDPEAKGLSFIKGQVCRFNINEKKFRVPHIGWNSVRVNKNSKLFMGIVNPEFYFVHSYFLKPENKDDIVGICEYGEKFCCAVERDNIFGVQFHPEKSQREGLAVLKNFVELNYA